MKKFFVFTVLLIQLLYFKNIIDINNFYSAVVSILLVCFFVSAAKNYEKNILIPRLIIILFLLFILTVSVSSLLNNYTFQLIPRFNEILIPALMIIMYLLTIGSYEKQNLFNKTAVVITFGGVLFSLVGILQLLDISIYNFRESIRPGAMMNVRNFASEYIAMTIPFILYKTITSEKKTQFFYTGGLFIVLNYVLALRTRSGILISAAILILIIAVAFTVHKDSVKLKFTKLYFSFLFVLIFLTVAGGNFMHSDEKREELSETFVTTINAREESNLGRIHYIKSTFDMVDNVILGNGAGTWYSNFRKFNRYIVTDEHIRANTDINPHNVFLEIYSDTGIAGVLIALFFFGYLIVCSFRNINNTLISLIFFATLLAGIFFVSVSFAYKNIPFLIIFTFAIANIITYADLKKVRLGKFSFAGVIIVSVIVMFVSIGRFYFEYIYLDALRLKSFDKTSEAIDKFDRVNPVIYPVDPNQIPVQHYYAVELIRLGKFEQAKDKINEALKIQPYYAGLWNNHAAVLYSLGEKIPATEEFLKTKSEFRNYLEPQINLLSVYMSEGEILKAKELFTELSRNYELVKKASNYDNYKKVKEDLNE